MIFLSFSLSLSLSPLCLILDTYIHTHTHTQTHRYNDALRKQQLEMGGLEAILRVMKTHPDDSHVLGEAIGALTNLTHSDDVVSQIEKLGGVDLVVQTLLKHPEFPESSLHGMRFLGKCIEHNFDAKHLIEMRGVEACLGAMKAHPGVELVAQGGLFALQAMAEGGEEAAVRFRVFYLYSSFLTQSNTHTHTHTGTRG